MPLIFAADGERCIVVASKGGAPEHPHWYRNLVANPTVQVQIKGDRFTATARTVEGAERERCWALATAHVAQLRRVREADLARHPGRRAREKRA